jgi:hypothetical protein
MSSQSVGSLSGWADLPTEIIIENIVPYFHQDPTSIVKMMQVCQQWRDALEGGRPYESPVFKALRTFQNISTRRYEVIENASLTSSKFACIEWKVINIAKKIHPQCFTLNDPSNNIQYTFFYKDFLICLKIESGDISTLCPLDIGNSMTGSNLMGPFLVVANASGVHFFKRLTQSNLSQSSQLKKITSIYSLSLCPDFRVSIDETKVLFGERILDFASPDARIHTGDTILAHKFVRVATLCASLFRLALMHIILNVIFTTFDLLSFWAFACPLVFVTNFLFSLEGSLGYQLYVAFILASVFTSILLCFEPGDSSIKKIKNSYSNLNGILSY